LVCRTSCDICAPDGALTARAGDVDLPDEEEQIRIVLRCVADVPWNWQSGSLVAVLRGGDDAPEPGRQCKAFGALSFRSEGAVEKMVDSLVRGRMFYRRRLDDGNMVLDLTSAGRKTLEAVARPTTLPHADARQTVRPVTNARPPVEVDTVTRPLDDGRPFPMRREERRADPSREANGSASPTQPGSCQPSEAAEPLSAKDDVDDDVDRALLERLRRWCKEMARAEGVPIFMVFQDVVLQRIAMFRPRNEMQLLAIKGIRDRKIAKYGAAILAIVRERDQNTKAANQP
jgi:superfamily II DNA helicase RecQ